MKKAWKRAVWLVAIVGAGYQGYWALGKVYLLDGCGSQMCITETVIRHSYKFPLNSFGMDIGRFPTSGEGLQALLVSPGGDGWRGPYIQSEENLLDPWGNELQYRSPGIQNANSYDLFSFGPDGVESGDDIRNWD